MAISKNDLEKFLAMDPEDLYEAWEAEELKNGYKTEYDKKPSGYSEPKFEPTPPPVDLRGGKTEESKSGYRFDLFEESKKSAEGVKDSTKGMPTRATVKKKKVDSRVINNRLKALGLACLIAGGIAATIAGGAYTAHELDEASLVNPHVMSFHHEVMDDNIHRTYDNQGYFYDYDDISEFLTVEGEDFSRRLFIMVEAMGVNQTNRVLNYVPGVDSVEEYVKANNFEDIETWKENEVDKLRLERDIEKGKGEIVEKEAELDGMFSDNYSSPKTSQTTSTNGIGGNK